MNDGIDNRDQINVLMNVDSYYGEHQGRLAPVMLFLAVSAVPFVIYVFMFTAIIPLKWIVVFEIVFTARMALLILGKEGKKLAQYKENKEDEYAQAADIVRVAQRHRDGLVEYVNGDVVYIISGMTQVYFNESAFSVDLEKFLKKLDRFNTDFHMHLVVDEDRLQDGLEKVKIYDKVMMKERIGNYVEQDMFCSKQSKLYKVNLVVHATKYEWKELRAVVDEAVQCEESKVFKWIRVVRNAEEISDIMSRDDCMFIDIEQLLQEKFSNEDYDGSRVVYYGKDVPDEFVKEKEHVDLKGRRVSL